MRVEFRGNAPVSLPSSSVGGFYVYHCSALIHKIIEQIPGIILTKVKWMHKISNEYCNLWKEAMTSMKVEKNRMQIYESREKYNANEIIMYT